MCGRFLPSKEHDPYRLCIALHGKSCSSDHGCEECHDWSDNRCSRVADYVEKLSLYCEMKEERETEASSSSFSSFSPSMPVPQGQLPSPADSGVVTMSALTSSVYAVTYSVVGPAVTTAPFVPPSTVIPIEPDCKRHCVEDHKDQEHIIMEFKDWWVFGKSAPLLGPLSYPQP